MQSYLAPSWLKGGGHVETIFPKFISAPAPAFRRELLPDSTGQAQVAYDFVDTPRDDTPLVVLFHGLEGNSSSHYAQALMAQVKQKQWLGVVVHYRGCGGVVNLSDKAYHSGDSLECAWVLKTLANRHPKRARFAMGVSLGGNVLAKYLGESRDAALFGCGSRGVSPFGFGQRQYRTGTWLVAHLVCALFFAHFAAQGEARTSLKTLTRA